MLLTPQPGPRIGRFSGAGFIAGIGPGLVTVAGAPARRRVILYDKATDVIVARSWSNPDGTYRFDGLNPDRRYYVVAFDHQLVYNAVIRDNIKPATDD